jgi:cyclohexanone monooxygenase
MNEAANTNSWIMGTNILDKKPRVLAYFGGANVYFEKLNESREAGFPELQFSRIDS